MEIIYINSDDGSRGFIELDINDQHMIVEELKERIANNESYEISMISLYIDEYELHNDDKLESFMDREFEVKINKRQNNTNILLKDHGLNVNHKKHTFTHAIESENKDLIYKLAESNIDINSQDEYGRTACFYACFHGKAKSLSILIECGCDINQCNKKGRSPIDAALHNNKYDCLDILLNAGKSIGPDILYKECNWFIGKISKYFGDEKYHVELIEILINQRLSEWRFDEILRIVKHKLNDYRDKEDNTFLFSYTKRCLTHLDKVLDTGIDIFVKNKDEKYFFENRDYIIDKLTPSDKLLDVLYETHDGCIISLFIKHSKYLQEIFDYCVIYDDSLFNINHEWFNNVNKDKLINWRDDKGRTKFFTNFHQAEVLINLGVDHTVKNNEGEYFFDIKLPSVKLYRDILKEVKYDYLYNLANEQRNIEWLYALAEDGFNTEKIFNLFLKYKYRHEALGIFTMFPFMSIKSEYKGVFTSLINNYQTFENAIKCGASFKSEGDFNEYFDDYFGDDGKEVGDYEDYKYEYIKTLLKYDKCEYSNLNFMIILLHNDTLNFRELINKHKLNINIRDSMNCNMLWYVKTIDQVDLLLEMGIETGFEDCYGRCPLHADINKECKTKLNKYFPDFDYDGDNPEFDHRNYDCYDCDEFDDYEVHWESDFDRYEYDHGYHSYRGDIYDF